MVDKNVTYGSGSHQNSFLTSIYSSQRCISSVPERWRDILKKHYFVKAATIVCPAEGH
jgi:hypothetical protein